MTEWPLEWADLTCPRCGSEPGLDCRSYVGHELRQPHRERLPDAGQADPPVAGDAFTLLPEHQADLLRQILTDHQGGDAA